LQLACDIQVLMYGPRTYKTLNLFMHTKKVYAYVEQTYATYVVSNVTLVCIKAQIDLQQIVI